jgi:hypothetical protein
MAKGRVTRGGQETEFAGGYFPVQLKRDLERAASEEGRTLTQEMIRRLRESLKSRKVLTDDDTEHS